nr:hypothetical protein DM860_008399 [Ipomoea trifida]GMD49676.1 hypothetical protein DM860_008399 [Ipomoea batatas]GMD55168.1 hypothetical protein DM860_008399 [Ipomoea batatas]
MSWMDNHYTLTRKRVQGIEDSDLELGGFHGDGNANENDSCHGDGGIAFPVDGPAIRSAGHGPDLGPEVGGRIGVVVSVVSSTHVVESVEITGMAMWNWE